MNLDERLSKALHTSLEDERPSPDLADRMIERITVERRSRAGLRFPRLVGSAVVALLVLAISLGLAVNLGSGPGPGQGPGASGLAHFDRDGLAFDYPASWHVMPSGVNLHYITILDFLGTGSGAEVCKTFTPPPDQRLSGPVPGWGIECGPVTDVRPGQILVTISRNDGPFYLSPIDPSDQSGLSGTARYVTVGGLPAVYSEISSTDQSLSMNWVLSMPGDVRGRYELDALIRAPGIDSLRSEILALVDSLTFDPPAPVLDPADGPRIAAIAVAMAEKDTYIGNCYPTQVGVAASSTITRFPNDPSPLPRPLPVTCTTQIEPTAFGLWKLTLTISWTSDANGAPGSVVETGWVSADGTRLWGFTETTSPASPPPPTPTVVFPGGCCADPAVAPGDPNPSSRNPLSGRLYLADTIQPA